MEVCSRRIVVSRCCKSINQLAGRIALSGKKLCHGKSAFHAALPSKKSSTNLVIVFYPGKIDDAADIENNSDVFEALLYHSKHCFFTGSQIEISIRENFSRNFRHRGFRFPGIEFVAALNAGTIPAFAGKTADYNQGDIRKGFGTVSKLCCQLRFYSHSGNCTFFILVLDVCLVKCR